MFLDIASLLVEETNRYANRDKNKPEFNVTLNKMLNFVLLTKVRNELKRPKSA